MKRKPLLLCFTFYPFPLLPLNLFDAVMVRVDWNIYFDYEAAVRGTGRTDCAVMEADGARGEGTHRRRAHGTLIR